MKTVTDNNQKQTLDASDVYVAPSVEIEEVVVEQGFLLSGPSKEGDGSW